jgi:two-component system, NtrC family, response regulator AtoC
MHKLARHYGLPAREFSPEILSDCQHYSWPGNVSELENFVKRYLMIGDAELNMSASGEQGSAGKASTRMTPHNGMGGAKNEYDDPNGKSLKSLIRDVKSQAERNAIAAALERTGWNRKAAARMLKVSYRTMLYKIEQYRMTSSDPFSLPFVNGNGLKGNGNPLKDKAN